MTGRHLHLDLIGGLAGDMLVAALLDLGATLPSLVAALKALPVEPFELAAPTVIRGPFAARAFQVLLPAEAAPARLVAFRKVEPAEDHGHDPGHSHDHGHGHGHSHDHGNGQAGPPSRSWRQIRSLLEAADLPPRARSRALAVFAVLARAEGKVHGMPPDAVTFHEVGALDSIIDIVGACLALEQLDVDQITVGPIPLGSGSTQSQHGRIPLPAPATVELLLGFPVEPGPPGRELVTPTGAALLAALARPGRAPAQRLVAQGYGAGTRDPKDRPNVVRALLGDPQPQAQSPERVSVIEAQMDDLTGEHLPPLLDALLAAGALDALALPCLMKKGRPGLLVQVLCRPDDRDALGRILLRHGSSFGLRHHDCDRVVLDRWHGTAQTPWGPVRVKVGALDGEILHLSPEFTDVQSVAQAAGQPVPRVHWAAVRAADPEAMAASRPEAPAPEE